MKKTRKTKAAKPRKRGYDQVSALNFQNSDWKLNVLTEDADVWQNQYILRARIRDLYRTNPYFQKYREELWANVFGEHGIALRMKAKENEDRVVNTPDEKTAIKIYEQRVNKVREWVATKTSRELVRLVMTRENNRGQATIIAGQLDVFANQLIERRWDEWKRAEYCDLRGQRDYSELQQIRILSAARDGGHFIRCIEDPSVNKFGFTLQQVNDEWCDYWLNKTLPNGNVIRMGIERQMTNYGPGKPIAYHFLRQFPESWQWSQMGGFSFQAGLTHDEIPASQIIHYARYTDNDSTRPAPWGASVIPKSRQLDGYEIAEVTAARVSACKMGWFYSDLVPEGGDIGTPDPKKTNFMDATPGGFYGLPYGVKFEGFDPNHPNGNFDTFRKGMLRSWCAGMPGANYNIIANDAEGVSYSTGRIFSLDDRDLWKLIQRFDIRRAETPIFERWLRQALVVKIIPLPLQKFDKFNQPHFSGRRWTWIDPKADALANREQLLMGLTSRSRLSDDGGVDFDDVLFELAEEEVLIQEFGLNAISLESMAQAAPSAEPANDEEEPVDEDEQDPPEKPKKPKRQRKAKAA
jgi:lambda family phage portal protein